MLADLLNAIAEDNSIVANLKQFLSTHNHFPRINLRGSRITDLGTLHRTCVFPQEAAYSRES